MEGGQPTWDLVRNREATDLWEHHKQKERNHVGTSLPRMVRSASIYLLFAERSHKLISLFQIGKQMKYVGIVTVYRLPIRLPAKLALTWPVD